MNVGAKLRGAILGGAVLATMASLSLAAVPATVTVHVDQPGITISPEFYGLMTEEINHAYDGGLYAELIQNRTFQDNADQPAHWSLVAPDGSSASMTMTRDDPVNDALPVSLQLTLPGGDAKAGVANDGYWGIPVKPNTQYKVAFYAKGGNGFHGALTASLQSDDGQTTYASADTEAVTGSWTKYNLVLNTKDLEPTTKARFVISGQGAGTVSLSLVSVFPPTYNNRPNGLRIDLMEKLAQMKPSFIRLPGGNYVEGSTFPTRYNWKQMIGPIDKRPGHMGCWGYRSSDGMGLLEMLEWCEDLHAEPLLAVFAGYTLNRDYVPAGEKLQPYVDEALEEIEYCTGDVSTPWGKKRAEDGHPEPFKIKYVEVGNEDWFDRSKSYDGRFKQFYDAIKAKYPNLQVIATTGNTSQRPDVIDDHYYRSAQVMAFDAHHYDKTDRSGPKIFVGEWASKEGEPTPTLKAGLGDAAWLMGLERDSDIVTMEAYAPLFVNVNPHAWQWGTNLIGYDALNSFGSPSFYVQALFAQNAGDVVLPADLEFGKEATVAEPKPHGRIGVGTWRTQAEFKDITVTPADGEAVKIDSANPKAFSNKRGQWDVQDGALAQHGNGDGSIAYAGDVNWSDYTVSLKARKTGGAEGFLIVFRASDPQNQFWWNIGGWDNSRTAIEETVDGNKQELDGSVPMQIESDRWYDLRLEVKGQQIKTYIDGKLVNDVTAKPASHRRALFASATKVNASNEVIVKLVNMTGDETNATIDLQGITGLTAGGKAFVIAGDSPTDQNDLAHPTKVATKEEAIDETSAKFDRKLAPWSVTLLRLKAAK